MERQHRQLKYKPRLEKNKSNSHNQKRTVTIIYKEFLRINNKKLAQL